MSLCPDAEFRASLDDGEFWEYVFNGVKPGDPRPDREIEFDERDVTAQVTPEPFAELNPPYSTIVADPPWSSRGSRNAFGARGMAEIQPEAHYSTMNLEDIAAMPVRDLTGKDAHCYLWTTCSDLSGGLYVLNSWGFTHKTTLTWVKEGTLGLGAYFRTQTEHVLFGVRGSLPTLARDQRTFFVAKKRGHSVKPAAFGDLVERCSPGPYVELFARAPRLGWDSWGKGYETSGLVDQRTQQ